MSLEPPVPVRLLADWVLPVGDPPIQRGAVVVGPDGRLTAVGPSASVGAPPGTPDIDFGTAAIIPGLVNTHTHLELTGLAGRVEEQEFHRWIRGIRELKTSLSPEWFADAARRGVRDAFAAGITMVLDTGDSGAVLPALAEAGGAGIVYQEVFGPDPSQCPASLAGLEQRVDALLPQARGRVGLGVSPHAPYSVSGPLYRATAELARRRGLPMAVHLAESPAETAFVTAHRGPFAEAWNARGIPPLERHGAPDSARRSPVAWLDAHGVLGRDTLVIHAVQLDDQDVGVLRSRDTPVAHCPLSNRRHGHGDADPARLLRNGVRLGVGTDSVVSVGRLDLFAELRAARALAGLPAADTLALGTEWGARAAGVADAGRLAPGWHADVAVVRIPVVDGPDGALEAVLAADPEAVLATWVSGRSVYRRGKLP